jgi:hypothetical protein
MTTRFTKNVFTAKKSVLLHVRSEDTTVVEAVSKVLYKVNEKIVNDEVVPTTTQLNSVARVLAQLQEHNANPSVLLLLNTCLSLITKYKLTADKLVSTMTQLEAAQFKASLLDDIEKVKAYLLNQGAVIFPAQRVTVQPIEVTEAVSLYIQRYGLPIDLSKLALIEENLKTSSLTLDGTLYMMIQQFIQSLT